MSWLDWAVVGDRVVQYRDLQFRYWGLRHVGAGIRVGGQLALVSQLDCLGLVLATNAIYAGDWRRCRASVLVCIVAGCWLLKRILDGRSAEKPKPEHELEITK